MQVICIYFKGRNFRGRKFAISRFLAQFAKVCSREIFVIYKSRKFIFAKKNKSFASRKSRNLKIYIYITKITDVGVKKNLLEPLPTNTQISQVSNLSLRSKKFMNSRKLILAKNAKTANSRKFIPKISRIFPLAKVSSFKVFWFLYRTSKPGDNIFVSSSRKTRQINRP